MERDVGRQGLPKGRWEGKGQSKEEVGKWFDFFAQKRAYAIYNGVVGSERCV